MPNERELTLKAKFEEVGKIIFSSGLTVGEIVNILRALQANLDGLTINYAPPAAPVAPAEEAKEEKVEEDLTLPSHKLDWLKRA